MADGSFKTIDNKSDLWWALKGAGHNFGIVTSITSKVYEIQHRDWAIETLVFSGEHVEKLYQTANEYLLRKQPEGLINWSYWVHNPDADPENVSPTLSSLLFLSDFHSLLFFSGLSKKVSRLSILRYLSPSTTSSLLPSPPSLETTAILPDGPKSILMPRLVRRAVL